MHTRKRNKLLTESRSGEIKRERVGKYRNWEQLYLCVSPIPCIKIKNKSKREGTTIYIPLNHNVILCIRKNFPHHGI